MDKNRTILMVGGALGTRGWHLARALKLQGYKVTFLTDSPIHNRFTKRLITCQNFEGINIIIVPSLRGILPWKGVITKLIITCFSSASFLLSFPFIGSVDIVYSLGTHPLCDAFAILVKKIKDSLLFLDISDTQREALKLIPMNAIFRLFLDKASAVANRILYTLADGIIAHTVSTKQIISKYTEKEIHVIYNVIDIHKFHPMTKEEAYDKLSNVPQFAITKGKFVVLYAGMMGPLDDLGRIMGAAEKLKNFERILFLLVGEGEEKGKLMRTAQEHSLKNVVFIEKQPWELMPFIINIADVCLLPLMPRALLGTFLPKKFFEYAACGKPIICFCPYGEVTNLVQKWNAGIVVDPTDVERLAACIENLSINASELKMMGKNSRIMAEKHFSLDRAGSTLANLFSDTIKLRRNREM